MRRRQRSECNGGKRVTFLAILLGLLGAAGCGSGGGARGDDGADGDGGARGDGRAGDDGVAGGDGGTWRAVITVDYDEPVTRGEGTAACIMDGGALTNLDHTTIYYSVNGSPAQKAARVAAKAPTGGGHVTQDVTLNGLTIHSGDITVWTSATDTSGNESLTNCAQKISKPLASLRQL